MTIFLEASDVARRIGRAASTVNHLADRGALPVVARTTRGTRLFTAEDVDEFLRRRRG
jgi:DNA-binding transcriptional MerR regulator